MSPHKRRRQVIDNNDSDDEILEVQEASSNLRNGPSSGRKRVRVSPEDHPRSRSHARFTVEQTSDSELDRSDDEPSAPASPPQTQYEFDRDQNFEHLNYIEQDDARAEQKLLRRQNQIVGDNAVAESGIIESVTCYNFMCHERLHVELGPLINFIVGENGSGKSAVLTALTLCLGGKASDTNRGGSLRSFVKEGRDHASLVVKIKNAGTDAYQRDIYGESITVERHFSKTGSSGFKIKSVMGRIISTKKNEVDEISEWYTLQIGNPLIVLSQDNARQFLNSASPAQKYKYFISGVQLEQLDNDYKMSSSTLDQTEVLQIDLKQNIAQAQKDMEAAHRLADTARKNSSLRTQARLWRNQMVWSQVEEQEKALETLDEEIAARDQRILRVQQKCEDASRILTASEEKLEQQKEQLERLKSDVSRSDLVEEADRVYRKAKSELEDLHREERDCGQQLKGVEEQIQELNQKITAEENKLNMESGSQMAEKDAELRAAREREEQIKQLIEEASSEIPRAVRELDEVRKGQQTKQRFRNSKKEEIVAAEKTLKELRMSSGGKYDGYERDMAPLVKLIAEDTEFQHKPIGPIGAYTHLKKPEWTEILEKTFGEALNAFVVRSKRDQSRLSVLMRRFKFNRPPPIYIAYSGSIDTSAQEPSADFDTILRVLEFDDDIVRAQLIINNSIEKIILVKERRQAESIMTDGGQPPRNVLACLCFHDGKTKRGHGLRITNRNGNAGTAPITPIRGARPRMLADSGAQVKFQEEKLQRLGIEMRDINSEEREAQLHMRKLETTISQVRTSKGRNETELRLTQANIETIQEELDSFEGADARLNSLRQDLVSKEQERERVGDQFGNMRLSKRELNSNAEQAKKQLNEAKDQHKDQQSRTYKVEAKIQSYENGRRIAVSDKNSAYDELEIAKMQRRDSEAKRDSQAKTVVSYTDAAREFCAERVHIPEGESHASLEHKYQKLKEQLEQRRKRLGANDADLFDRETETKARHEDLVRQSEDMEQTVVALKQSIQGRLEMWRRFQRQISARVRIQFVYLLSERGFRGRIVLDHKPKKVYLQIEPDETRKSATGRNTKTLSGGEKSFSSICMLLAIWEAIGSPIRCLDEFDVFMDNVNRAISTNMLVDTARRSVSKQYILITPNAIEGRAKLAKDVKIIRLTDPRQRTLI